MELPETEIVCRQLRQKLAGRRLLEFRVFRPGYCLNREGPTLSGRNLTAVERHGKLSMLRFSAGRGDPGDVFVVIRFGMTGQALLVEGDGRPPNHTHLMFEFDTGVRLILRDARRFGGVTVFSPPAWREWVDREIGPDPFELNAGQFGERFKGRKAPIKHALLNQKIVSGIGNIYSDEALFEAGIHPKARADSLGAHAARRLHGSLVATLKRAIEAGGSTISDFVDVTGRKGRFQLEHRVYGKFGEPCPKCGSPFRRIREPSRSYTYCQTCQPRMVRHSAVQADRDGRRM